MSDHRGRFDHLFTATYNGSMSWRDRLTTTEREWLDELVDAAIAWGKDPNWKLAIADFADQFGQDRACATSTLAHHVRSMVKERSGK